MRPVAALGYLLVNQMREIEIDETVQKLWLSMCSAMEYYSFIKAYAMKDKSQISTSITVIVWYAFKEKKSVLTLN